MAWNEIWDKNTNINRIIKNLRQWNMKQQD